jgi:putative transcriptional regulator
VERHNLILTRLLWKQNSVQFQSLGEADLTLNEGGDFSDQNEPSRNLRAFTGYAGWSAGQLEQEIAEKSWHLLKPSAAMLHPITTPEEGVKLWKSIMRNLGPWHELLSQAPDDLSLN